MLNKRVFVNCLGGILLTHGIEPKDEKTKGLYDLMKNDFGDSEFESVCEKICKEEELFGKYPTPPMFYKRKITEEDKNFLGCNDFLDKVSDYIESGYVSLEDKEKFINGLSEIENSVLRSVGGISQLWEDCHREEYPRSVSSVLREIKELFLDKSTVFEKVGYIKTPQLESERRNGFLSIGEVLKLKEGK